MTRVDNHSHIFLAGIVEMVAAAKANNVAKPFDITVDFEKLWQKYAAQIRETGLSYPNLLLVFGRKPEPD